MCRCTCGHICSWMSFTGRQLLIALLHATFSALWSACSATCKSVERPQTHKDQSNSRIAQTQILHMYIIGYQRVWFYIYLKRSRCVCRLYHTFRFATIRAPLVQIQLHDGGSGFGFYFKRINHEWSSIYYDNVISRMVDSAEFGGIC